MLFLFSITWGTVSGWWVPACLVLGLLYAWLLYRQPVNLAKKFRIGLFAVRAIVVAFIALLLVSPLVKSVSYNPQKPLVLVLQDNSESINLFKTPLPANSSVAVVAGLAGLKEQLGDKYDVQEFNFDKDLNNGLSKAFNGKQTNLSNALHQLNDRFVNQNIGALVIASDGLYNQGSDPQYEAKNFKNSIYTIAEGDTVAKRDLLIGNINYNKTAFLGNDFEVEILAEAYQSKGENIRISITEDGKQVNSQNIAVTSNSFQKQVIAKLNADKKGLRRFNITIAPIKNEISTLNNSETIYVDVLDAKQKVLLLYEAPHPDLSVIRQAIESNKNYEVKASLLSDLAGIKPADYNLVILYQLSAAGNSVIQNLSKSKVPLWYIAGAQTDLNNLNDQQKIVRISSGRPEMQEVFAQPTTDFTAFTLSDSSRKKISSFPPLLAPYGNYGSPPAGSVLLRQRIGSVETTFPLLSFGDAAGQRIGVLNGEGLWRWQLAEYEAFGNHHAVEELLSQGVQYLTANASRQRFIVYTAKHVFDEGENVLINAELYNDALELVNTPDVRIELKNAAGKDYSFLFSRNDKSYQLDAGTLPIGEYSYTATTKIGAKQFTATGQLTVKPLNLESRQSAANHQLLNTIAKQSGGQMLQPSQINQLADLIRKNENIKTVVYEDKRYSDIIDVKWVFVIILLLLSLEWFLRKREGEI
ncbi:hypothetical protein KXD93_28530 [Mucilaginibacter sp. BJC16-A38]|uniref:hypothetical protein n=1 Tax=Mucilaginibacter phenanthrenivorans TaxID=1234842 RepID=UPI002157192A|nr:hypothetical protein [Mucilaginibacter phenanthrenivorans]MCR8561635.1 hypothetical protein [Mucilaginibacter phenanthrenivorans]